MAYAPQGKSQPVLKPGEFFFAVAYRDHGHIFGRTNGFVEAGRTAKWVYDPDPEKVMVFQKKYLDAKAVRSLDEIFVNTEIRLVASDAVPCGHGWFGCRMMDTGKDYYTDLAAARERLRLGRAPNERALRAEGYSPVRALAALPST